MAPLIIIIPAAFGIFHEMGLVILALLVVFAGRPTASSGAIRSGVITTITNSHTPLYLALIVSYCAAAPVSGVFQVDFASPLTAFHGDKFGILHAINNTAPPNDVLDVLPVSMCAFLTTHLHPLKPQQDSRYRGLLARRQ
jgi:hypothetical protein